MKPILFNGEIVKAILDGRKTQTRRVIKLPSKSESWKLMFENHPETMYKLAINQGPYHIGDILWVRETWLKADDGIHYKTEETSISKEMRIAYGYKWKPSIHMPRTAARIFLKVTDVRVERLQDITEGEALDEGCKNGWEPRMNGGYITAMSNFEDLWNSTIKKQNLEEYGWRANPFVWVIEFERVTV